MDIRGHINCWRFVGRDCRFPDYDCFNVRIHDGLKTEPTYRMDFEIGLD